MGVAAYLAGDNLRGTIIPRRTDKRLLPPYLSHQSAGGRTVNYQAIRTKDGPLFIDAVSLLIMTAIDWKLLLEIRGHSISLFVCLLASETRGGEGSKGKLVCIS